jgi:hypothetical protein
MLALALVVTATAQARNRTARLSEKHICKLYRCVRIAASAQIRVVEATARRLQQQTPTEIEFAEWLPTGRVTILAKTSVHGPEPSHFAIAGRFVAYVAGYAEAPEEFSQAIVVLNVETARKRETPEEGFPASFRGIVQVAVTPAGSAAWMKEGVFLNPTLAPPSEEANGRAVYALPATARTGRERVLLAHSLNIVPLSLAATRGHIYWLEAGIPRTFAAP